jgi:ribosomal protein S18 acetylase RimI-like enzyme
MYELKLSFRAAEAKDQDALQALRAVAFKPVFASFRAILGDVIYEAAQAHEDADQENILSEMFIKDSIWRLTVAELGTQLVGFISVRVDTEHGYGEIGLNAIAPEFAGRGYGTAMYEFALAEMRRAGVKVATVATGGDPSHAPARRAYEKAGFNVSIPSVWMCRTL